MKRGLLAIIAISLFASCADDRSASVADIVSQWEGREILFPENSVFTIQGRDTVDFQFLDAPYKILTYVDSVGCMSCKLQLMNWSKYIQELDSVTGSSVPVAFFINASNQKELSYITRRDGFKHPVCFDEKDELNSLNQFSADMTFQTFLLNGENRVVGIGNPVHNANVKALYYRIINGEGLPEASSRAKTSLVLEANEIDFGRFGMGEPQTRKVQVTNTGSELLGSTMSLPPVAAQRWISAVSQCGQDRALSSLCAIIPMRRASSAKPSPSIAMQEALLPP